MTKFIRGFTQHLRPPVPGWPSTDPLDRGLVGEWRFDPAGKLVDYSGWGHHGIIVGAEWATCPYGVVLDFEEGDGDYAYAHSVVNSLDLSQPWTVEAVIIPETTNAQREFFCFFTGGGAEFIGLGHQAGANFKIFSNGHTGGNSANTAQVGKKSHVFLVFDGTDFTFYLDGNFDYTVADGGIVWGGLDEFFIGTQDGASEFYDGLEWGVRVYNRALTAGEVYQRSELGLARTTLRGSPSLWYMPWGKVAAAAGPQTVNLNALSLAGSVPNLSVTPGAVSMAMDALTLAGTAETLGVQPGGVSLSLNALTLAGSVEDLSVSPGAVSVLLDALSLTGSAESLSVVATVIVALNALSLASSAENISVAPGAISAALDALTLASSAPTLSVALGAVSVALNALSLASSAQDLTVAPGAISVTLDGLSLASSAETLAVSTEVIVALNQLSLTSSAQNLSVSPGAVTVGLDALTLVGSAESISVVLAAVSIALNALSLSASAEALSVDAEVSVALDALSVAASARFISTITGPVAISLDALSLTSSVETLSVLIAMVAAALGFKVEYANEIGRLVEYTDLVDELVQYADELSFKVEE